MCKSKMCQVVSSLNHFREGPREMYLDLTVPFFCYVKIIMHNKIIIDFSPMKFNRTISSFIHVIPPFIKD